MGAFVDSVGIEIANLEYEFLFQTCGFPCYHDVEKCYGLPCVCTGVYAGENVVPLVWMPLCHSFNAVKISAKLVTNVSSLACIIPVELGMFCCRITNKILNKLHLPFLF